MGIIRSEGLNELRRELLALATEDGRVRQELAVEGSLYEGYHPRMEAVHRRNAARLAMILDEHGWPVPSLVGPEGAEAAWLIAQHAIGEPAFQRRCLRCLREAAGAGDLPSWQPAMLEDRIRMFEGRPQLYGTQLETDHEGRLRPYRIEDPERVEERRRQSDSNHLTSVSLENSECQHRLTGSDLNASTRHGCTGSVGDGEVLRSGGSRRTRRSERRARVRANSFAEVSAVE